MNLEILHPIDRSMNVLMNGVVNKSLLMVLLVILKPTILNNR